MRIAEVMVRDLITIEASATLVEAARLMRDTNVGVLPVVEGGVLRGVLTDRDLVVRGLAQGADPRAVLAGDCASREPIVADADWDTDQALELMARHQVGRLPVVDADDQPIGIVTLSSLALRARRQDEALSAAKEVSRRSARGAERTGTRRAAGRKPGPKRRLKRAS
jgi:CBS domain-containing protein